MLVPRPSTRGIPEITVCRIHMFMCSFGSLTTPNDFTSVDAGSYQFYAGFFQKNLRTGWFGTVGEGETEGVLVLRCRPKVCQIMAQTFQKGPGRLLFYIRLGSRK